MSEAGERFGQGFAEAGGIFYEEDFQGLVGEERLSGNGNPYGKACGIPQVDDAIFRRAC